MPKERESVGMVANYLEEFMEQVPETFLSYEEATIYLKEDRFHNFVRHKNEQVYEQAMKEYEKETKQRSGFGFDDSSGQGDLESTDSQLPDTDL